MASILQYMRTDSPATVPPADNNDTHALVFRCHDDMEIGAIRCPADPASPGQCAEGYTGYLCGTCSEGYGMLPSNICELCAGTGYNVKSLLIVGAMIAGSILIVVFVVKYWSAFPAKYAIRCAFQPMRMPMRR